MLALGTLALHRNRELTVIFAVVTGLGSAWASHAVGISPAGEFAFVLGSIGRVSGVVGEETFALVVSSAIVSFFLSAFLVSLAAEIENWRNVAHGCDQ